MKILNAEKFAAKVMENGTEIEVNDSRTMNCEDGETVWSVYAHIDADGNLVHRLGAAEWTVTADMKLTAEQSEALMNGELDDMEKAVIISDLYPQYVATLKENEDWINL